jgi:hypothetical protein
MVGTTGRLISAAISAFITFTAWFGRETMKAWIFDHVLHSPVPSQANLVEYGIPAAFAALCVGLLLWRTPSERAGAAVTSQTFSEAAATLYPLQSRLMPQWREKWLRLTRRPDTWVSLRDAATELYNRAQGEKPNDDELDFETGWAESISKKPDDVLNYFGVYIAQTRGIPLRGRRLPATVTRDLKPHEVTGFSIEDGATSLRDKIKGNVVFTDLMVKRSAITALIMETFRRRKPP